MMGADTGHPSSVSPPAKRPWICKFPLSLSQEARSSSRALGCEQMVLGEAVVAWFYAPDLLFVNLRDS